MTKPTDKETTVVNLKDYPHVVQHLTGLVYIGRRCGRFPASKWANPFKIGRQGTREQVIAKYEEYIRSRSDLMAALPELVGKRLGCWCAPLPCHGDILVKLIKERKRGER